MYTTWPWRTNLPKTLPSAVTCTVDHHPFKVSFSSFFSTQLLQYTSSLYFLPFFFFLEDDFGEASVAVEGAGEVGSSSSSSDVGSSGASGVSSSAGSDVGSSAGSGLGSSVGSGVGSSGAAGVGSSGAAGEGSSTGSGVGSTAGSGVGSAAGLGVGFFTGAVAVNAVKAGAAILAGSAGVGVEAAAGLSSLISSSEEGGAV
mmetsp:Transcript_31401/g.52750  ORF Transcript_31401/g.52750 Transcript_31401/m.52750 type:complete len:201 (-) Transcript_31401:765-1367(-)